jgi:hypothetical protein
LIGLRSNCVDFFDPVTQLIPILKSKFFLKIKHFSGIFMREIDCSHSRSVKTNTSRENEPFILHKHVIFIIFFSIFIARIDKA